MRRGLADLSRRARVAQASNNRHLDALASVDASTPLDDMLRNICQPATWNDKRVRALRPWSTEDAQLFEAVNHGEFAANGFRNRDLQTALRDIPP